MDKMLDSLKDLEKNFYAIYGLYGFNQEKKKKKNEIDMNDLLNKLDTQIKALEDDEI